MSSGASAVGSVAPKEAPVRQSLSNTNLLVEMSFRLADRLDTLEAVIVGRSSNPDPGMLSKSPKDEPAGGTFGVINSHLNHIHDNLLRADRILNRLLEQFPEQNEL